jgi:hypothetical protein
MMNFNQLPLPHSQVSVQFRAELNELSAHCLSFAACVRLEHQAIEQAISYGVPIEAIARKLSDTYGVQGSLSAFKSGLSRMRRVNDGIASQRWLNENAPLSAAPAGALGNVVPQPSLGMQAAGMQPGHFPIMNGMPATGMQPNGHPGMDGVQSTPIHPVNMPSLMPFGVPVWSQVLPGQAQYSGTQVPMSGQGDRPSW